MWWKVRAPNTIRPQRASRRGGWQIGCTERAATATSNAGREGGGTESPELCPDKGGREIDAESAKRSGSISLWFVWLEKGKER